MERTRIIGLVIIGFFNPVTLFLCSTVIQFILASKGWTMSWASNLSAFIFWFLYLFMFFMLPFWIYLTIHKKGQNEEIQDWEIAYAGFWKRVASNFIDGLSFYLIIPIFVSIYFYYRDGQTLGKKIMGIAVVDISTRNKPSWWTLFARPFAKLLSSIPLYLGLIWVGFDKEKRGWHDHLCKTWVIELRSYNSTWTWLANTPIALIFLWVLASSAITTYQSSIEKARDVMRQTELRTISNVITVDLSLSNKVPATKEEVITLFNENGFFLTEPLNDRCYFYASNVDGDQYLLFVSGEKLQADGTYPLFIEWNFTELKNYFSAWSQPGKYFSCSTEEEWLVNLN